MEYFEERCIRCGLHTRVTIAEGSTYVDPVFICDVCKEELKAENVRLDHLKVEVN